MHWSGLLESDEVTQKIAAFGTPSTGEIIKKYIGMIKNVQEFTPSIRTMDLREVVDTNVPRFFRIQFNPPYIVVDDPTGQAPGMTLMTKISW